MYVLSSAEMKYYDKFTIQNIGMDGIVLMENAGKKASEIIEMNIIKENDKIVVLCGTGNNGGDGMVITRWLLNHGYYISCYIIGDKTKFSQSARINFKILKNLNCSIQFINKDSDLKTISGTLSEYNVIVDAIFGIGLKGAIKGYRKDIIKLINKNNSTKIAIDIPSGVNADTGIVANVAIKADYTITMAALKYGHVLFPGREFCGKTYIVDIGISQLAYENSPPKVEILNEIKSYFPARKSNTHKGDYGKIAIIAGSPGFTGAAIMACKAALEMGAGLITLLHPQSLSQIFEINLLEIMTKGFAETSEKTLSLKSIKELEKFVEKCDAVAVGPGISRNEETAKLIRKFLKNNTKPAIVDADAINAFQNNQDELDYLKGKPYIFTPHIKEFSRISGYSVDEIKSNIIQFVSNFSQKYKFVLLLKGSTTVISYANKITINLEGNPGLSTGGSGDVLTGIIISLLGQDFSTYDAARIGAFLLGRTADILADKFGERAITPSKIIQNLHKCLPKKINKL